MKIRKLTAALVLAMACTAAYAQDEADPEEDENGFSVNADFVSAYAWRGGFCAHSSFQPQIEYSVAGFSFGTWASHTATSSEYTEIDWYAYYRAGGFTFGFSDYCWTADDGFCYFGPYSDNHYLEGTISYTLGEFPLMFSANTMVAGANRDNSGSQAFSTYINAIYSPTLKCGIDLSLELGLAIEKEEAAMYSSAGGFQCVNIDLGLSKTFPIKDLAELTVQVHTYCNPKGFSGHGEAGAMAGVGISF